MEMIRIPRFVNGSQFNNRRNDSSLSPQQQAVSPMVIPVGPAGTPACPAAPAYLEQFRGVHAFLPRLIPWGRWRCKAGLSLS